VDSSILSLGTPSHPSWSSPHRRQRYRARHDEPARCAGSVWRHGASARRSQPKAPGHSSRRL